MIVGWLIKILGGGIIEKAIDAFTKTEDYRIRGKEIDAGTVKEAMKYYVENQKVEATKWSFPWFPLMVAPFIFALGFFFITLTAYNIFWHPQGMFPQTWKIAAYPGVYQEWATTAFNWVFAPAIGALTLKALLK